METKELERYAELKNQIKILEEEASQLNEIILNTMLENNSEEVEFDMGKISISKRKTWTYPEAVKTAEENLKAMKKDCERVGTATYTESPSLRFYPIGTEE